MKKIIMTSYFHNGALFHFFEFLTTLVRYSAARIYFYTKTEIYVFYFYYLSESENRIKKSIHSVVFVLQITNMFTNVFTLDVIRLPWQPLFIEHDLPPIDYSSIYFLIEKMA